MIYLDNSSTSFPKPDSVYKAANHFMTEIGANPGRSNYKSAIQATRILDECRRKLARFFGAKRAEQVIYALNGTDALNMVIKGLLKPGDHVISTVIEHNSVIRPLNRLTQDLGITVDWMSIDSAGLLDPDDFRAAIKPNTRLIAVTHLSNITGVIQPVKEICRIAKEHGVVVLIDACQAAGILRIDVNELGCDFLAASGHKSLFGLPGTGVLIHNSDIRLRNWREGGSGGDSSSPLQPDMLPTCLESGTQNIVGIAGLKAGIEFIESQGIDIITEHDKRLIRMIFDGIDGIKGITVLAREGIDHIIGCLSFIIEGLNPIEVCTILDSHYDIAVRGGLHCAPLAHRVLGTGEQGAVRVSPGYFNTDKDCHSFIKAIEEMTSGARG